MLSRVLGFVRDLVLARVFGADAATDAFFVAFKIPNFLRQLFAEGAFATAFVPVLTEYKTQRSQEELKAFVDHVAGTLALILLVVSAIGVLAAPVVVSLFAFGWVMMVPRPKLALAAEMLRLTFPYLFFISLTAFAGGVLNAHNRFAVPAFTPVLLNISLIGCALWLSPMVESPIVGVGLGGADRRYRPVHLPAALSAPAETAPVVQTGTAGRGRAAHHEADAAGAVCGLRHPDQPAAGYGAGLLPGHRQYLLALLLRPPDGVSPWGCWGWPWLR